MPFLRIQKPPFRASETVTLKTMKKPSFPILAAIIACLGLTATLAFSEEPVVRMYGRANPFTVDQLPEGTLKTQLQQLTPQAKERAMQWLHGINFNEADAASHLRVDPQGGVFITCSGAEKCLAQGCSNHAHGHTESTETAESSSTPVAESAGSPGIAAASVSINSPPAYNSKPGAPNHIYLDFNGAIVSGKAWNSSYSVTSWNCKPFSTDGDTANFSDEEQLIMFRTWQRVAEDFAPYNVNVTTDVTYDPVNYSGDKNKVGWLLMTDTKDKNGVDCPHAGSGGVAYVDVFGRADFFSSYQPAWVAIQDAEDDTFAEVISHEFGHNLGLSHDGRGTSEYYQGHGSGELSWGPIMGASYGRNITQWSKGGYSSATQTQDDLAIIANKLGYRDDDHGDTPGTATELVIEADEITIVSTKPNTDPANANPENKGIVDQNTDFDVFSFQTGSGPISITVNTYDAPANTNGGNLDVYLELKDSLGDVIATADPQEITSATISVDNIAAGTYFLYVSGTDAGTPSSSTPSGYTSYGSLGQYFISGTIQPSIPRLQVLSISPDEGETGETVQVTLTGRLFNADTSMSLKKDGEADIVGTFVGLDVYETETDSYRKIIFDVNLAGAALGDWDVFVTNPAVDPDPAATATLPDAFTVILPILDLFDEDFDDSSDLPEGWTTYSTTGATPLWGISEPGLETVRSVSVTGPADVATKYLQSPSVNIPEHAIEMKFSFWHSCNIENGYDGGVLEFSIDGGEWFDVISSHSGASFLQNGYNKIISKSHRSPISERPAWSGKSDGYIQTIVKLDNSAKYAGKSLRVRWLLASDNAVATQSWNVDTVAFNYSLPPVIEPVTNDLLVESSDALEFTAYPGAAATPTSLVYTLTNTGDSAISWSAGRTKSWTTLSETSGSIPVGESLELEVTINSNSISLPVGVHTDVITITNLSIEDGEITRDVNLTIEALPASVTLSNLNHVYNGSAKSATATTNPTGLTVDITYDGSSEPPTDAGSYPVEATIDDLVYSGTATGTMVIAQATPTISAWPTAATIFTNQPTSAATLTGGTASVPGTFSYASPDALLPAGTNRVAVNFVPDDSTNYKTISGSVSIIAYNPATVPDVVNLTQSSAQASMTSAFINTRISYAFSDTVALGSVVSQSIAAGTVVVRGSTVDLVISKGPEPSPKLVRTTVNGVSTESWTTVNLSKTYTSPVIIATPIYSASNLPPVVTRIQNVTSNSFELKLDRADALNTPVSMNVAIVVVNEGVYTLAQHGVKMEAVKYTSTVTASGTGSWVAEARSFQNTYSKPVVVGQVMSYNDSNWSVFWSMGTTRANPVSSSSLRVGKHVGLDPSKTRANEQIGYIVIETGTGTMDGVKYRAALGADTVKSFGDSAKPYVYTLSGLASASTAAVSQSGIDGTEGSWAVLSGNPALTKAALRLHVAEDGFVNTLRKHTNEQVSYIVFE